MTPTSHYVQIVIRLFRSRYRPDKTAVAFTRAEIEAAAVTLGLPRPKNLGDAIYAFKHRRPLPPEIQATAAPGREWVLVNRGIGQYAFEMRTRARIQPNDQLAVTPIPDATPGIVTLYALDDEQALLAQLRYNRMLDIFTGIACYSLQNHLRTTAPGRGQIETDEIYVAGQTGMTLRVPSPGQRRYGRTERDADRTGYGSMSRQVSFADLSRHRCPVHAGKYHRALCIRTG